MSLGPHLEVDTRRTTSGEWVMIRGEIDLASAPMMEAAIELLQGVNVVVDLTGVQFIDSAGLMVLIKQQERLRASGGELRLNLAEGPVTRLLELTGLSDAFPRADGRDQGPPPLT